MAGFVLGSGLFPDHKRCGFSVDDWLGKDFEERSLPVFLLESELFPDHKNVGISSCLFRRTRRIKVLNDHKGRVAHISLVFREMWDSTNVSL
jgi:hypothetical protein